MTFTDTKYLLGEVCPDNPNKNHLIPVRVSSAFPVTLEGISEELVEFHVCSKPMAYIGTENNTN